MESGILSTIQRAEIITPLIPKNEQYTGRSEIIAFKIGKQC